MNELLIELKKAQALASKFQGGYSERFMGAEEFAKVLEGAIKELESGNSGVLSNLYLWFAPTSDWDDFIKSEGMELGQKVFDLLKNYQPNT